MSKELEALNKIQHDFGQLKGQELVDCYELIFNGLKRIEAIDNAKANEALGKVAILASELGTSKDMKFAETRFPKMLITIQQALQKAQEQEALLKSGDLSDGYHTFNQLYYQRCILFASLVRLNKDKSWKSFKHSDGKYCFDSNGEWFIVGIDTPIGSYTYHYEKKYWDLFECQELEYGKEWDGHTEEDVTRLLSLPNEQEKVLSIIKKKCFYNYNLNYVATCINYDMYKEKMREVCGKVVENLNWNDKVLLDYLKLFTEEEFNTLKRWQSEKENW